MTGPENEMPDDEVQAADPTAKKRALVILLLASALGAAAIWLLRSKLDTALDAAAGAADLSTVRPTLLGVSVVLGAGLVAIALWLISFGRRIEEARRFPPADARLIQDTVIRRGQDAVRLAWILYGGAAVLFVSGIAIPFQVWRLLESLVVS